MGSWLGSPPMSARLASKLILGGLPYLTATINVSRATGRNRTNNAASVCIAFLPRRNYVPDLFGPKHVDLVVFLHHPPVSGISVDAAVPGIPPLRRQFVAIAPFG